MCRYFFFAMRKTVLVLFILTCSGWNLLGQSPADLEKGKKYWEKAQVAFESKDYKKTFKYDKMSAELGYCRGMNSLGVCYGVGYGTTKNYELAIYWYEKALEHPEDAWTYSRALMNIASYHVYGKGVPKDLNKAARIVAERIDNLIGEYDYVYNQMDNNGLISHASDNSDVAYVLDFLETKGCGKSSQAYPFQRSFEMRSDLAIDKVKAQATSGNKEAAVAWAKYLYYDIATEESKKEAVAIWSDNTDKVLSQDMLIVAKGEGLYSNTIPKEWYLNRNHTRELYSAAKNGNREAQFTMGIEYDLKGSDTRMEWYEKAAAQGHDLAAERLEALKVEMAAREKEEQERKEQAAKEEAARKAKILEMKKNCEGKQIVWTETISIDLSDGGTLSTIIGAMGYGGIYQVSYTVQYVGIVEKVIAGSSVKCIIKKGEIMSPGLASANWLKYRKYAQASVTDEIGKTRVLEMDEFDLK